MTITLFDLGLYAAAMAGLWAVPGPVRVALTARAHSGGMAGAWPLAMRVPLGDLIWPLCAILGLPGCCRSTVICCASFAGLRRGCSSSWES